MLGGCLGSSMAIGVVRTLVTVRVMMRVVLVVVVAGHHKLRHFGKKASFGG